MGKKTNGDGVAARLALVRDTGAPSDAPPAARREERSRLRTLGPVSDLERHLPSEWWRTLFNSLYLETDGDIVENDRNTEQEVDLWSAAPGFSATIACSICAAVRVGIPSNWRAAAFSTSPGSIARAI
jgi:hypothetical protein